MSEVLLEKEYLSKGKKHSNWKGGNSRGYFLAGCQQSVGPNDPIAIDVITGESRSRTRAPRRLTLRGDRDLPMDECHDRG